MSPQLFSILTIVIIGSVSFLIGWLLTSTRWKKNYYEQERVRKILENKTAKQEEMLKKARHRERVMKEKLALEKSTGKEQKRVVEKLQKINTDLRSKMTATSNETTLTYNQFLNGRSEGKKKAIESEKNLEQLDRDGTKEIATTVKKVSQESLAANLSSFVQDKRLLPILERVSIFSNPKHEDDLSAINGISVSLATRLHKAGFVNFKQVAMLTEKDLCIISEVMEIESSRAMEDSWVAQARLLYHKKYR